MAARLTSDQKVGSSSLLTLRIFFSRTKRRESSTVACTKQPCVWLASFFDKIGRDGGGAPDSRKNLEARQ